MAARLGKEDAERVEASIREAKKASACEIRLHIQKTLEGELMEAAVAKFNELGMTAKEPRLGVLIYVARDARQLTILGDEGVQAEVDASFWDETVEAMASRFKAGKFADGLVAGIESAGKALAKRFPRAKGQTDELDDSVSLG